MTVELWVAIVRREILTLLVLLMKEGSVTKSLSRFVRSLEKEQCVYVYAFNSSILIPVWLSFLKFI